LLGKKSYVVVVVVVVVLVGGPQSHVVALEEKDYENTSSRTQNSVKRSAR